MSDFILEYDILEAIATYSNSLGKRSLEYAIDLENKIIDGISSVTGSTSVHLESASDDIRDKINALKLKSEAFYHFSEQLTYLLEIAQQVDQEVADTIAAQRGCSLEHHKSQRIENWKIKLLESIVKTVNSNPLLGTIADLLGELDTTLESLKESIESCYKYSGGKLIQQWEYENGTINNRLKQRPGDINSTEVICGILGFSEMGKGIADLFTGDPFKLLKNNGLSYFGLKSRVKNGIVDLKDNIKRMYTNSTKKGNITAATEKPEYTISALPDDYVPSAEPDYQQLGPGTAFLLGVDSEAGGIAVSAINIINSLIGKPLITQEVIDYNKKNTTDFAERYTMGEVTGAGAIVYTMVAGGIKAENVEGIFEGASNAKGGLNSINSLDDLLSNPNKLSGLSGGELYSYLIKNGYDVKPLSKGSFKGVSFEEGGGFKVNWGGDRILQYHPESLSHHGGAYFKISSGETGTIRIDLDGNIIK